MRIRLILYISFLLSFPLCTIAGEVPDSVVASMQQEKAFRYANDPSYWTTEKVTNNNDGLLVKLLLFFINNPFMKWVMYAVLTLVILFIIYQILVVNKFFVFSGVKRRRSDEEIEQNDDVEGNIDEAINTAVQNGEWRMAVRHLYLKTLMVLSERNLISRHAQSTNNDYLNQMRVTTHYSDFVQLTRIYEYVWYGDVLPTSVQFEKIHTIFNQFISRH